MVIDRKKTENELMAADSSFRELIEEHRRLDEEVRKLDAQPFLIPLEQKRYSELKKRKLRLKDQIELRIQEAMNRETGSEE
jgi:uncharacterized protein YdcH (DUF465 family)